VPFHCVPSESGLTNAARDGLMRRTAVTPTNYVTLLIAHMHAPGRYTALIVLVPIFSDNYSIIRRNVCMRKMAKIGLCGGQKTAPSVHHRY